MNPIVKVSMKVVFLVKIFCIRFDLLGEQQDYKGKPLIK